MIVLRRVYETRVVETVIGAAGGGSTVTQSVSSSASCVVGLDRAHHPVLVGDAARLHVPRHGQRRAAADRPAPAPDGSLAARRRRPRARVRAGVRPAAVALRARQRAVDARTATRARRCPRARCCGPPCGPGCGRPSAADGLVEPTLVGALERAGYAASRDGVLRRRCALRSEPRRRGGRPVRIRALAGGRSSSTTRPGRSTVRPACCSTPAGPERACAPTPSPVASPATPGS